MPSSQLIRFALHGGAGVIDREHFGARESAYREALAAIAQDAHSRLLAGETSFDVVEAAVKQLEDCPFFNAGHGAVLNADGAVELDAAIMRGRDRAAGAVAGSKSARNPVCLARAIMEKSEHVLLIGDGADAFARAHEVATEPLAYFVLPERLQQLNLARAENRITLDHDEKYGVQLNPKDKTGTVGAVARDIHGSLAAATSTGGMTNKMPGRVGDAPLIGAGTWADDETCAISATGHGEFFIRCAVGYDIHARMIYADQSLANAADAVLARVQTMGGTGGLIAIDHLGNTYLPFNSPGMYRAWLDNAGKIQVAIYRD
jgi:L-asparaginase / beta-aspartyl-peptidase